MIFLEYSYDVTYPQEGTNCSFCGNTSRDSDIFYVSELEDAFCEHDILKAIMYDIRAQYKNDKSKPVNRLIQLYTDIYGSDPDISKNPNTGEYESPVFGDEMTLDDLIEVLEIYVTDVDDKITEKKLQKWLPDYDIYEVETDYITYSEPWD